MSNRFDWYRQRSSCLIAQALFHCTENSCFIPLNSSFIAQAVKSYIKDTKLPKSFYAQ